MIVENMKGNIPQVETHFCQALLLVATKVLELSGNANKRTVA
jgi:hypothetical protein